MKREERLNPEKNNNPNKQYKYDGNLRIQRSPINNKLICQSEAYSKSPFSEIDQHYTKMYYDNYRGNN